MAIEHSEDQQGKERKMEIANYTTAAPHHHHHLHSGSHLHHHPQQLHPHSQHQQFVPQYYYPPEMEGQFTQHYPDYEFLGQPMGGPPDDMPPQVVPGAGMAAAPSTSTGYESPPTTELNENQERPLPPNQHTVPTASSSRSFYHRAPPPLPQGSAPYPIVAQQSGPIRSSGRRPSATASHVLVDTDPDGTVWIKFEYTRNRVKWLYRVRCDVERVNEQECLTEEFKQDNCIYPKAMVPPEEYTGHRQKYETECNHLGWRLAWLNPDLRNRRGLIQRAVDSYRNSSGDISVRSRRVRRLAKQQVTPRR